MQNTKQSRIQMSKNNRFDNTLNLTEIIRNLGLDSLKEQPQKLDKQ